MQNCQYKTELQGVVGYIRVSTRQQGRSGLGLSAQERCIQEFCEKEGLELLQIFTEVQSGKDDDRPVLNEAMKYASRTGALICVAKLDRLSRKVSFISNLMETGECAFVSCELGRSVEPFMLHIWSAFAEAEAAKISRRTKVALEAKKATGWQAGNPRIAEVAKLGRAQRTRVADEFALKLAPVVRGFQANGVSTLSGLAANLNQAGVKTVRGGKWSATAVKRLLTRLEGIG